MHWLLDRTYAEYGYKFKGFQNLRMFVIMTATQGTEILPGRDPTKDCPARTQIEEAAKEKGRILYQARAWNP